MVHHMTSHVTELLPGLIAGTLAAADAAGVSAHLESCAVCRAALNEWEAVGVAAQSAAAAVAMPSRGVLDRAFAKIDAVEPQARWYERWLPGAVRRPLVARSLAGVSLAAAVVASVAFTPLGLYAQDLLEVFQPKQFVVVPVTRADLEALPSLSQYGDISQVSRGEFQVSANAAEAAAASGIPVLTPGTLPASVTAPASYAVVPSFSATFTFSADKASDAAQAQGQPLPPMPANIDGSSVQMTTGVGVVAVYGGNVGARLHGKDAAAAKGSASGDPLDQASDAVPQLIVGQARVPVATSSGASPKELEQYLLSQPGISDNLANAIRAIGDPTTTWPIPVPLGKIRTHSVTVQGVRGTVFSDDGNIANGVIWVKDGMIYGVAGPLGESDVLRVANSLH